MSVKNVFFLATALFSVAVGGCSRDLFFDPPAGDTDTLLISNCGLDFFEPFDQDPLGGNCAVFDGISSWKCQNGPGPGGVSWDFRTAGNPIAGGSGGYISVDSSLAIAGETWPAEATGFSVYTPFVDVTGCGDFDVSFDQVTLGSSKRTLHFGLHYLSSWGPSWAIQLGDELTDGEAVSLQIPRQNQSLVHSMAEFYFLLVVPGGLTSPSFEWALDNLTITGDGCGLVYSNSFDTDINIGTCLTPQEMAGDNGVSCVDWAPPHQFSWSDQNNEIPEGEKGYVWVGSEQTSDSDRNYSEYLNLPPFEVGECTTAYLSFDYAYAEDNSPSPQARVLSFVDDDSLFPTSVHEPSVGSGRVTSLPINLEGKSKLQLQFFYQGTMSLQQPHYWKIDNLRVVGLKD